MAQSALLKSSIAKKSGYGAFRNFLMLFLAQHFFINITSVFSPDTFNFLSHFMGNNALVQYVIQPILIVGVVFHFIMGFVLDYKIEKHDR
jgi:succinate dehydrogenase / fumarate reductase cytochrome b subunit